MTNLTDTNDQIDRVDGFRLEAEPEVPPVPACVELAKLPKTRQVVRRPMTADEVEMVKAIRRCVTFSVGHWDKKFMRDMWSQITTVSEWFISERQAVQVWRIFKTYRRQIVTDGPSAVMTRERKEELLRQAEVVCEAIPKPGGTGLT